MFNLPIILFLCGILQCEEIFASINAIELGKTSSPQTLHCDVYLIAGTTGSGKTTISQQIKEQFGGSILHLDSYIKNEEEVEIALKEPLIRQWDSPVCTDWEKLIFDLNHIAQYRNANIPIFSFVKHKRIGFEKRKFKYPYIIEGLYALDYRIISCLEKNNLRICKIFVDASPATRFERIEKRDVAQRDADPALIDMVFNKVIRVAEKNWIIKQKNVADFIVINENKLWPLLVRAILMFNNGKQIWPNVKILTVYHDWTLLHNSKND